MNNYEKTFDELKDINQECVAEEKEYKKSLYIKERKMADLQKTKILEKNKNSDSLHSTNMNLMSSGKNSKVYTQTSNIVTNTNRVSSKCQIILFYFYLYFAMKNLFFIFYFFYSDLFYLIIILFLDPSASTNNNRRKTRTPTANKPQNTSLNMTKSLSPRSIGSHGGDIMDKLEKEMA